MVPNRGKIVGPTTKIHQWVIKILPRSMYDGSKQKRRKLEGEAKIEHRATGGFDLGDKPK